MKYSVEPWMFEKNPNVRFGVVIGSGLQNTESSEEDGAVLAAAQDSVIARYAPEALKTHDDFVVYRTALQNVGINPNKFTHSVEAMAKRILKGSRLPTINALVDLCNAISLQDTISLGGHDLKEIEEDLWVRRSVSGTATCRLEKKSSRTCRPGRWFSRAETLCRHASGYGGRARSGR